MRALGRGLGFSVRAPELVLVILLVTAAMAIGPAVGGASDHDKQIKQCGEAIGSGEYVITQDINSSSGDCIKFEESNVVIDGQGHTISVDGHMAIKRSGQYHQNVTIKNVVIEGGSPRAIEYDFVTDATIANASLVGSETGIKAHEGGVRLRNVSIEDTTGDAIEATGGTHVDARKVQIGNLSNYGAVVSFSADEPSLSEVSDPETSSDVVPLGQYLDVEIGSGELTFHYTDEDVRNVDESSIAFWVHDGSNWQRLDESQVDPEEQTVSVSRETDSSSRIGLFADKTPYFDVSIDTPPDSIEEGENLSVDATVKNTGWENGTQPVALTTDGTERVNQTVSLNVGESTDISFEWSTGAGDAGIYIPAVESKVDSESWSLTIADPDGPVWETEADWNRGTRERTVSDGVGDRRNDTVRLGYPADTEGLVGYWPFDEAAGTASVDAAGNNDGEHTGTGTISLGEPGLLDTSSYEFDGSGYVEVEDDPSIRTENDMAVSLWVRTSSLGSSDRGDNQMYFLDKGSGYQSGFELFDDGENPDDVTFRVSGSNDRSDVTFDRSLLNDGEQWHHLVAVRDGTSIQLYLDGESVAEPVESTLDPDDSRPLTIGASDVGDGRYRGDMDEVRIYDRALSESEIQALYDTTRNGTHTTNWRPLTESLNVDNLQLNASASIPTGGDAAVYVETDTDADGVVDDRSDKIALSDGTTEYDVTNLSVDTDVVRIRTELETPDLHQTPVVDRVAIEEPADFQVTGVTANDSVVQDDLLDVNATVTNVGDLQGTQNVTLSVNGTDAKLDTSEITLDGGESTTVNLTWETGGGDRGEYEATVASQDSQGSTTVRVDAPAYFDVTLDDVTTQVVENETVVVNATVENTGDLPETENATLSMVNQSTWTTVYTDSTKLSELAGGETEAVGFTWNTTGYTGEFDATVNTTDDAETRAVSVLAEDEFFVRIDEVDESVVAGDPLRVNATVENRGEKAAKQQINLSADHGAMLDNQSVNLTGGESAPVNLTWETGRSDVGDHEMVVSSEDGFNSTEVTVLEPTNVSVDAVESNTPVLTGSTLDVTATVTNVGEVNGTQELNLTIGGEQEAARSVTVNASETKDVTLGWTTAAGDAGDYTARVHTGNDSATTDVRVDDPANLTVDVVAYDETVVEGDSLGVTANVTNVGDRIAEQELNLTLVDDGGDEVEVANRSVEFEPDESRNVTLTWPTESGDVGDYTAVFASENHSDSAEGVRVDAPANLTVDDVDHDPSVVEGQSFEVTANVTNEGDVPATQNVTLSLNASVDGAAAGASVRSREVTLNGSESTNVSLAWSTSEGDAGEYTATVATENDSATVDVDVLTPPNLAVEIAAVNDSVYENDALSVNATVENLGEAAADQTIALNVSSVETADQQVANTDVEVGGGNETSVSLDWTVGANATGTDPTLNYTATIASENDTDSAVVQVRDDRAYFVSIDDVASPVTEGDAVAVDATVRVHDGTGERKNVSLHVGGTERDRTNVSMTGENETSVTLTWATQSGNAGTYPVTVASEDHGDDASVTVDAPSGGIVLPPPSGPSASLDVAIESTNAPVPAGEPVAVSARVSNAADQELTETITLSARGTERDSRSVTVGPGGARTVELQWATTADDVGSHPVTVAGTGSSAVRYVDVVEEPSFDVEITDTTAPIDAGRPLRVTASIEATVEDTQTIELERVGGGVVDSESVSLAAGESTTVSLTWQTEFDDAGSGDVTVRANEAADSAAVQLRGAGQVGVAIDQFDTPVVVNESGGVAVTVENEERGERTVDVVLEIDGSERDVRTITLAAGASQQVSLSWTPTASDLGERELTVRTGQGSVTESVRVEEEEDSGGFLGRAPEWAGAAVEYEPTEQDTHVGGFLWLTGLIAGAGVYLLATRRSLDGRLLAATLLVAAFRTSTDVVHAAFDEVATEHLLALNTSLELYVGLLFLSFAASYVDLGRLLQRRLLLGLAGIGLAGTAVAATNARHGLVYGEVSLVGGQFTYVTAEMAPLGWAMLAVTFASLLASVGLLARSFLAGTDPTWRPVGVLAAGLCLAVFVVLLSVLGRGPLPQYDYTGAGVGSFLIVATTTAVGHGLHRIKHDAQKSLIQDLDDPIVIATDARVVVEFNAAAAEVLPAIDDGVAFDDLVSSALDWPAPGETTTGEYSLSELAPASPRRTDGDGAPGDALTDGAGRETPADDVDFVSGGEPAVGSDDREASESASGARAVESEESTAAPAQDEAAFESSAGESTPIEPESEQGGPASAGDAARTADPAGGDPTPSIDSDGAEVAPEDDTHYLVQATSVTADTGDSIGYTVRFTDVTELKRRTAELTRRNAQLEQVASTISHDLRNPMTVADGYVEMLQDAVPRPDADVQPATVAEHMEPIRESLARMDEIIADILALARSKDPATEERLSFGEAVEEAWATVDTGQATLFVESSGTVTADPGHLRRILENLFRNAVEHAGPDVAVLVGLTEDGFYVADDGPGIPEDRRDDVFEEGHTSNPDGTGLGLSIVSQLAHAQDWAVHLDSEYDGARFVLTGCETQTDGTGPAAGDD